LPEVTTLSLIHSHYTGSGAQPDFYPVVTKAPLSQVSNRQGKKLTNYQHTVPR